MYLRNIDLRQFRSYENLSISVDSGVNLFIGLNGSGKTNLLEAICVLTTGISPRGGDTENMTQWGTNGFFIRGHFVFEDGTLNPLTLEMKYQSGASRVIKENNEKTIRLRDLIGRVPIVSFVPEDLALVKGEPGLRRRALNMILVQVDPLYAQNLKKFNDTLRSRNAALKQAQEGSLPVEALLPWDQGLVETGLAICQTRARFIEEFSKRSSEVHERISGGEEVLSFAYKPSVKESLETGAREKWLALCRSLRSQEMAFGMTLAGPHRDDMIFLLNGKPARTFGSEGQKRTGAVSFKLAEIPYIQEQTGKKPLCLLDDVLSELDAVRAAHLLDELNRTGQCFVTLTGLESWPRDHDLPASIFRVKESTVLQENRNDVVTSAV